MLWRLLRALFLLVAGTAAGFAGAAAMVRGWLPSRGDATSDDIALVAIFDGIELESHAAAFRGGTILAWYGGVSLDLRAATLAPGASLEIRAAFGGVTIAVPPTWRVDGSGTGFAGGVSVPTTSPLDPEAPTLVVHATSIFGGVAVTRQP
jgi:hypothetical protein